ncbi:General transcriptional corepressor [Wickerhamomyces ciferrii]|uniref:General transcriptional corepressor n=1 Tax=Wickerhamomyces ciferrii (strain ATCC 14091 / BCRC 22168 / CBS 111 / JCM 3599 / NBRC 0793 / NRRL Y-1031 F-60-10) TaxID=1206466 RepID=K0KBH5_WICCF|nr:General transcriptional corepressor [Wickerhamomyces ciferrii]CCH42375.1 General transcriptional corepressor [Wickerhamomyces ciferrii]
MSYPQRPTHQNYQRLNELLEAIKEEFENVNNEASSFRLHKNEYDIKFNQQTSEMQSIKQTVYELELAHRKIKESYEDQLATLKRDLDLKDRQLASFQQQVQQGQTPQGQPILTNGATNLPKPQFGTYQPGSNVATPQQAQSQLPPVQQQPQPPQQHHQLPPPLQAQQPGQPPIPQTQQQQQQQLPPVGSVQQQNSVSPNQPKAESGAPLAPIPSQQQQPQQQQQQPQQPTQTEETKPTSTPSGGAQTATPATSAAVTGSGGASTVATQQQQQQQPSTHASNGYLVPANQRASHNKQIPPFLHDLDSTLVPAHLKKLQPDYYILYNPSLPKNVDVELVHSLDHSSVVCCVRFSNDGKFLATGCNKTTQVFGVETGELVARLTDDNTAAENGNSGADLYIRSVCFSPDGKYLATGAEDKVIRIWDLSTRRITKYLKGHEQDIYSLDFFPDGNRLVSGSGDRTVRIWDLQSGQCSLTLSIEDGVTTVAVSPDGKLVAAGSLDRTVRVWDSSTGFLVERLDSENEAGTGHKDSVYSVAFTSDGSEVASGSLDRTVKLWSLKQLGNSANTSTTQSKNVTACEVTYVGHKDFVLSVCSSPDSKYILSGSKDRGVIFWEKKTGDPLLMLQGHRNSVISVSVANNAISGNGMFATGSGDCKARIWRWNSV